MASNSSNSLQNSLAAAYQLIRQNKADLALSELSPLLRVWPLDPDLMHLVALAYKTNDDFENAARYFKKSLSINKQQPQVHNNLANLYNSRAKYELAEEHYRQAISMQANYGEAIRNLALCYSAQRNYAKALGEFEKALSLNPQDVSALTGRGDCYRELGDKEAAHADYRAAIAVSPQHLNAWHNAGLNFHLNGQLAEALEYYQHAYQIAPDKAEVVQSLALALHENGSTMEAINLFKQFLQNNPENVQLHKRFNEMVWETEFSGLFGDSYREAIKQAPQVPGIRVGFIAQLFRAGEIELARLAVDQALLIFEDSGELLCLKGQIQAETMEYPAAIESLSASLAQRFTKDAAQPLVKIYIIEAQYQQAQTLLDQLFEYEPDCQLTWALQSLIWRLTEDDRYHWLNNYEQLVQGFVLETPQGYESLDQFLSSLSDVLLTMHHTKHAPLQQTLRHGTQTSARLLYSPVPEIQALKDALAKVVGRYIDGMPDDPGHPLLSRKSKSFEFSGSWSVKLRPEGFHVNHVHPAGWISSSCYISIPESMSDDPAHLEGCIKFGESPMALGEREVVEKVVKPKPGMVVLFPSYMWHGTYPFEGAENEFRLTSPFDVVPL